MRKLFPALLFFLILLSTVPLSAQHNKDYFRWVGRNYLMDSKYEAAIETLNILINVDPNAYEAYFLRGIAKYNLDDLIGAEFDFTAAIEKNPVYTMAYNNRAITRMRLGNYDDALRDFKEAIDLRPDIPDPYYTRGVTHLLNQQFDKAIEDFNQFLKHESRFAHAYINRGMAYLHQQDTTRAFEDFNNAIRTNRNDPNGYNRRGGLYAEQNKYDLALEDYNKAIECDSSYLVSFFNRAVLHWNQDRPTEALADLDRVIELDSTSSQAYFNRAIIRTNVGDYNRALDDYNTVAFYSPNNVLVYYNRAGLYAELGNFHEAIRDYTTAIDLYPDFANAYLNRANVRYFTGDVRGSRDDRNVAERKIAEYRSKLNDSTFSIYADTSKRFNQLLSFDTRMSGYGIARGGNDDVSLLPLFRFTLTQAETAGGSLPTILGYYNRRLSEFMERIGNGNVVLATTEAEITADSLLAYDRQLHELSLRDPSDWTIMFQRGIAQSMIKQYTSSVNTYTDAIEKDPTNAFLYLNRSTTKAEMIDFISSIDNSYQRITLETDPVSRLKTIRPGLNNYDEAIADLNKAAKLFPDFAHIYYNRAYLMAVSGRMPEAYDDYTRAIELYPNFAEAYFNRGLIQILMKDTRKGCLDISKAGELGIQEAYSVLRRYAYEEGLD